MTYYVSSGTLNLTKPKPKPPILHHVQVMADIGEIFASNREVPHFNALARGDPLRISG